MLEAEGLLEPDFQNIDGDPLFYRGRLLTREEAIGLLEQLTRLREQEVLSLGQSTRYLIDEEESELLDLLGML